MVTNIVFVRVLNYTASQSGSDVTHQLPEEQANTNVGIKSLWDIF